MDLELRRDPQRLLEQIEEEERRQKRGRLKIFLGYASGVGKSAKMLAEGLRRRERGEDVVIGAIQPKSSTDIDRLVAQHEVIPTLRIGQRDVIDIDRILRRRPQVVVIDGLAYTNPPRGRFWRAAGAMPIDFTESSSWHMSVNRTCRGRTKQPSKAT